MSNQFVHIFLNFISTLVLSGIGVANEITIWYSKWASKIYIKITLCYIFNIIFNNNKVFYFINIPWSFNDFFSMFSKKITLNLSLELTIMGLLKTARKRQLKIWISVSWALTQWTFSKNFLVLYQCSAKLGIRYDHYLTI